MVKFAKFLKVSLVKVSPYRRGSERGVGSAGASPCKKYVEKKAY